MQKSPAVSTERLRYVWQNRQRHGEPVRLGPVVQALVAAEGLDKPSPLMDLRCVWEELVGLELSRHSRVDSLSRGVLRVEVDSAVHMAELKGLAQAGLAERMRARFDQRAIKSIRLRLGSERSRGARSKGQRA